MAKPTKAQRQAAVMVAAGSLAHIGAILETSLELIEFAEPHLDTLNDPAKREQTRRIFEATKKAYALYEEAFGIGAGGE